jgi:hypothetical protein
MASKHLYGKMLVGLLIAGAAGAVAPACAHDDSTLFIRDVISPAPVAVGQICTYTSDPTQPFVPSGILDTGLRGEYDAVFLVGNQMVPQGNPNTPATETSYIKVDGAVVRVTTADGKPLDSFTTLVGTTINPSVGTSPSYSPVGATIVDGTALADPRVSGPVSAGGSVTVVTYTRFFGHTLGGQSVESNEFEFPVTVCYGCLVSFPADEQSGAAPSPNCGSAVSGSTTATTVPCVPGQDQAIDCAHCLDRPVCLGTLAGVTLDAGAATD